MKTERDRERSVFLNRDDLGGCYEEARARVCMFSLDPGPFAVSTKSRSRPSPLASGCLVGWEERAEADKQEQGGPTHSLLSSHPLRS